MPDNNLEKLKKKIRVLLTEPWTKECDTPFWRYFIFDDWNTFICNYIDLAYKQGGEDMLDGIIMRPPLKKHYKKEFNELL